MTRSHAAVLFCMLFCIAGVLTGCGDAPEETAPQPTAQVSLQAAQVQTVSARLQAYGTVEFSPAAARSLVVQLESQVAEVRIAPGAYVHRGERLMKLVPSAASQLDIAHAARDASTAQSEQSRVARLREQGLATKSELQTASDNAAVAIALRDSLAARQGGGVEWLLAPQDGIVESLAVQPGEVIASGSTALRIAAPHALVVRLGIEPEDSSRVHAGLDVALSALGTKTEPVLARISSVDSRIDPQTHQLAARIDLAPDAGLLSGAAVQARIVLQTHTQAVVSPRTAIAYPADASPFLFVAVDGHAQRREVKTGIVDGDQVEILEGLKAGEPVVVAGNYELEDGMALQVTNVRTDRHSDEHADSYSNQPADASNPAAQP